MNSYSSAEIEQILVKLGASGVQAHSNSWRSVCPIHGGDNPMAFATWVDSNGDWKSTCHSHGCVKKSDIEWIVRRVLQGSIQSAVAWIASQLGRTDLIVSGIATSRELQIQDDPNPSIAFSGNSEELARLQAVHPYHQYWRDRGYSQEIVTRYGLTYRSLDYRAIIPVFNAERKLLGTMERSTNGEEPKYRWNSPNSNKSSFLFGLPQALEIPFIINGRRVGVLVEGSLDPLKAVELNIPTVASQTNRLSGAQAQELIRNFDLVITVPDNDLPGASLVADVEKRCSPFIDTAVFRLPPQFKDLDDVPASELVEVLTPAFYKWQDAFSTATRHQRAKMLDIT